MAAIFHATFSNAFYGMKMCEFRLAPNRWQAIIWTNNGLGIWRIYMRHSASMGFNMAPWWRHQMETFSALLASCAGNSPVPGEFPAQRPVTRSFDVFFDLRPNKRLSKQWLDWWFETPSSPLWRHCNANNTSQWICMRFTPCCVLWCLATIRFTHILQVYFIGIGAVTVYNIYIYVCMYIYR